MESPCDLQRTIEKIRDEVLKDWRRHKQGVEMLSDKQVEDRGLDMLILYLIKNNIIQVEVDEY
ncbi:MAG TPA: hypothetical protein PK874_12370 [Desulfobacteraceae bacterium]|nr:hypothetical protein [Desulfobacteraceae bacterium]HPQ28622.1 hypothetical protein [Desulfobacteraceae bacterium]